MGYQTNIYDFIDDIYINNNINKKYLGLSYQGSKRNIATTLCRKMYDIAPQAKYFFDLFGGGASMSICATQMGYKTHYNEINSDVFILIKYFLNNSVGCWDNIGFISKALYKKYKEIDFTYSPKSEILYCYSFNNSLVDGIYLYNNNETLNENIHNFALFYDKSSMEYLDNYFRNNDRKLFWYVFNNIPLKQKVDGSLDSTWVIFIRDLLIKAEALSKYGDKLSHLKCQDILNMKQTDVLRLILENNKIDVKQYANADFRIEILPDLEHIFQIKHLFSKCLLQSLKQRNTDKILFTNLSYENVDIYTPPSETIIYCDIPYKDTKQYNIEFDYDRFYQWSRNMKAKGYNVFISEYTMPQDFNVVYELEHKKRIFNNHTHSVEKLFQPK